MSDDKKEARMNVLRSRHDAEDDVEENEENQENNLNDRDEDGESGEVPPVRDRAARTMYAGQDVIEEIDIKYEELSPRYRRKHGERLEKNDVYYPALLRAGVYGTSLERELGLDEGEE